MTDWLVLAASLPTSPSGLRVRVWRSLKATGCASLRDGVYILPSTAATAGELWTIEKAILDGGADAHMLVLKARDEGQEKTFLALFDRAEQFADFAQALKETRKSVQSAGEADLHKSLRGLDQQLRALQATDFFPGKASAAAAAGLETLRVEIHQKLSPGEPLAASGSMERLERESFQGRTWATRKRPWVDRLATGWLIQRFVDSSPRFVWLADPSKCPKGALGFDFDGAAFTHVGDKVSFEVVAYTFGLEEDPGIRRLGDLVHYIDVGGIPVDEAAGVETIVRGLQAQHDQDDALLAASLPLFDTLYAAMKARR
jgi:hypothetical protein